MIKEFINTFNAQKQKKVYCRAEWVDMKGFFMFFISGMTSIDENSESLFKNDFDNQVNQTYNNIISILKEKGLLLTDVVNFRIYLRNIDKHYKRFCELRTDIFKKNGIDETNPPSSTCVGVRLCRKEFLIEIDALAIKEK